MSQVLNLNEHMQLLLKMAPFRLPAQAFLLCCVLDRTFASYQYFASVEHFQLSNRDATRAKYATNQVLALSVIVDCRFRKRYLDIHVREAILGL
uniref:Uncharacterized protein n=1 Tax=Meloidogyne incognita TaxID=6306 RepID=A0A914N0E2_MELIC